MNKIINWVGGSFFRTIGRILVYILLGFLLSYLLKDVELPSLFYVLKPIDVYAYSEFPDVNNIQFTINNSTSTTSTKIYTSTGNVTFKFYSDELFEYNGTSEQIKYGYISMCVAEKFNISTYTTGNYTKNFRPTMTDIPCQMYNTSAYPNSKVLYMTFDLNLGPVQSSGAMCKTGVSTILCELDNGMTIYVPRTEEWTLNSYGFSSQPFEYDTSTGTLISQNTTIIDQNNQIISGNTAIKSSVDSAKNAIDSAKAQAHSDSQAVQGKIDNINGSMNNSDTSEATSSAGNFFSNFSTNQHGLTGIITAPLTAIQSLTSKTCSPLVLPLPFVNQNLELPCMRTIYDTHFGNFMQLYDIITLGIISYWVMVRIFALVKDFKNPEHDEIEVVDL